jgi:hypothetical protein
MIANGVPVCHNSFVCISKLLKKISGAGIRFLVHRIFTQKTMSPKGSLFFVSAGKSGLS